MSDSSIHHVHCLICAEQLNPITRHEWLLTPLKTAIMSLRTVIKDCNAVAVCYANNSTMRWTPAVCEVNGYKYTTSRKFGHTSLKTEKPSWELYCDPQKLHHVYYVPLTTINHVFFVVKVCNRVFGALIDNSNQGYTTWCYWTPRFWLKPWLFSIRVSLLH